MIVLVFFFDMKWSVCRVSLRTLGCLHFHRVPDPIQVIVVLTASPVAVANMRFGETIRQQIIC